MPSVIALDAMGSDKAPKPEIEGALQAARHHGIRVLLVGPEPQLRAELARYPGARRLPVDVVHASEVITMDDKVEAIRARRDSSIRVGLRLVREGRAAGFVTAGNTGAAMATAKVVLGDGNGNWRCPPGEVHASALGLDYRVWSSAEINWILQRNLQFLEDYLRCDPAGAAGFVDPAIKAAIEAKPGILLQRTVGKGRRRSET